MLKRQASAVIHYPSMLQISEKKKSDNFKSYNFHLENTMEQYCKQKAKRTQREHQFMTYTSVGNKTDE